MGNFDIASIKLGNTKVFTELFCFYEPKLKACFYSKVKSEYLVNEIVQVTFVKLWRYREHLTEDVKLSTQIFQIAKTSMIDELRKDSRVKIKMQAIRDSNYYHNNTLIADFRLEEKEVNAQLRSAVDQLPPIRKQVFLLSRENNLSNKEISAKLRISVKTVNKHIQLALRQIKPFLFPTSILILCYLIWITVKS